MNQKDIKRAIEYVISQGLLTNAEALTIRSLATPEVKKHGKIRVVLKVKKHGKTKKLKMIRYEKRSTSIRLKFYPVNGKVSKYEK